MPVPETTFASQFPLRYDDANTQFEISSRKADPYLLEGRDYNIHDVEIQQIQRVIGTGNPTGTILHILNDLDYRISNITGITGGTGSIPNLISNTERDVSIAGSEWNFNTSSYLDGVLNDLISRVETHIHVDGSGSSFKGRPIPVFVDNSSPKSFDTLDNRVGQNLSTVVIGSQGFVPGTENTGKQGDLDDLLVVKSVDMTGNPQVMLNVHDLDSSKNQVFYAGLDSSSSVNRGIGILGGEDGVLVAPGHDCVKHRVRLTSEGTYITEGHIPHSANFILNSVHDGPLAFTDESRSVSGLVPTGQFFDTPYDEFSDYYVSPLIYLEQNPDEPGSNTGEWGTFWREKDLVVSETGSMTGGASTCTFVTNHYPSYSSVVIYGPQIINNGINIQNINHIQWNWPGFGFPNRAGQGEKHFAALPAAQKARGADDNSVKIPLPGSPGLPETEKTVVHLVEANIQDLEVPIATPDSQGVPKGQGTKVKELFETFVQTRMDDLKSAGILRSSVSNPLPEQFAYSTLSKIKSSRGIRTDEELLELETEEIKKLRAYRTWDYKDIFYDVNDGVYTFADPIVFQGPRLLPYRYKIQHGELVDEHVVIDYISNVYDVKLSSIQIKPDFAAAPSAGGASPSFRLATYVGPSKYYVTDTIIPPDWNDLGAPYGVGVYVSEINRMIPAGCNLVIEITSPGTLPISLTAMPYVFLFMYEYAFSTLPEVILDPPGGP